MTTIKIVIVDDHTLFRTGLYELLSHRDLEVAGMTGNAGDALDLVINTRPDIVLLDLRMGEIGGLDVLQSIRNHNSEQRVIILTTSIEEGDVLRALQLGADGYLLKDMDPDELVQRLREAHSGETVVAQDFTSLLARVVVSKTAVPGAAVSNTDPVNSKGRDVYKLTPREMDILSHIAKGESNKHIASELGIVDGTVKLHVRQVLKKLGVKTRVQAALLAVSEGLCSEKEGGET